MASSPASAYTVATTPEQNLVRLRYGQKLFLAGNPARPGGFPENFFRESVLSALFQWKGATQGVFDFEYWQGTDPTVYEPNLSRNGLSSIFFASNSSEPSDPNIIGYTQVWYNARTGDIVETDIVLNDRHYELTTQEADTSSQKGRTLGKPRVFIGNILTHEIGHALGLSHSAHLNSSMLYVEYSEQNRIGCDDWAGVRHLYPPKDPGQGRLQGTVLSPQGDPAAGVTVTAISQLRGIPIATGVTDQEGRFDFAAIEAGRVALMFERFPGAGTTIPSRLQSKTTQTMCGGRAFPTQFLAHPDGHQLLEFEIPAGQTMEVGPTKLHCNSIENSRYYRFSVDQSHFVVDQSRAGASRTYRFMANGPFQVTGLGHLLLSPLRVRLQAYDSRGRLIAAKTQSPLYRGNSSFQIDDMILRGTAQGWVDIRVTPTSIYTSRYPTPALWPNPTPFYLLVFNPDPDHVPASSLPLNARCTLPHSSVDYQSPPGPPIRSFADRTSRDGLGCSSTAHAAATAGNLDGEIRPLSVGDVLGRLLPGWLLGLGWLYFRRRARKLRA